jgi:hypothetical protein
MAATTRRRGLGEDSTRSLRLVHQVIGRAIRHAQAADLVGRNVASLVSAPEGRDGRPSRSLTLEQAGLSWMLRRARRFMPTSFCHC